MKNLSLSGIIKSLAFIVIAIAIAWHTPAFAHHGGAQEWQFGVTEGPLTGVATKFSFTFPHILIYLDVTDEDGSVHNYVMNSRWTPTVLRKRGWSRNSIKPGDTLTVTYIPHRSREYVGAIVHLEVNGVELPANFDS